MTRSSYGPEWDIEANHRRLAITRAVTAELLAKQTSEDWSWVVLLDERDPLWQDRVDLMRETVGSGRMVPMLWTPPDNAEPAPWDKHGHATDRSQRVAATAYKFDGWRSSVGIRDDQVLMTRLDDDDGLAVDAINRVQLAARGLEERAALMMPVGVRVWDGRFSWVRHPTNAMHTLSTPPGDETTVYDYGHRLVERGQPVITVDQKPGWIWVRHADTISGWKKADTKITPEVRALFPLDWSALR
jgi:hypothetical protein